MPTVIHRLARWAEDSPADPAQRFKKDGQWHDIGAREYLDRILYLALYFESKGIKAGGSGAIFSFNRPEWVHVELALTLIRAKCAGLYPNASAKDVDYILNHVEAQVVAIQNRSYFDRIFPDENNRGPLGDRIQLILVLEGDTTGIPGAVTYPEAIAEGKRIAEADRSRDIHTYLTKLDPKEGCLLIYTSGTTGNPKGALLSHDNLAFMADVVATNWKLPFNNLSLFSFLPLCHVAEQLQNVGVGITQRYVVSFASTFDNVSKELPEVKPMLLLSVPRLWEKMMETVQAKVKASSPVKKLLAEWAFDVGRKVAEARWNAKTPNPVDQIQYLVADKLVLSKVRQAMGLDGAFALASGAAALAPHVCKWFRSLGLEIREAYGQTESTSVICLTEVMVDCAGTVGKPANGFEFRLADDGEIQTRGRHVFVGYYKDAAATASTVVDGWLLTGDLGEVTAKGQIRIKGRKKEIMKTSGGKMIAPVPIEERLKAVEMIGQVCLVGDGRKYISALITLSEGALQEAKAKSGAISGELVTDPETLAKVRKSIDEVNESLAGYEQIKKFTLISREFSVADGEMTPTMKMKRNVIEAHFKKIIDGMYD